MKKILIATTTMFFCLFSTNMGIAKEKKIVHEKFIKVYENKITPQGGVIKISNTKSPLDGFELEVPAGAVTAPQTIEFSWAKAVYTDERGEHEVQIFSISPFKDTHSGGGYADEPVILSMPKEIKQYEILVGLYYVEESDELDNMIYTVDKSGRSAYVTRHFNHPFFFIGYTK